MHIHKMFKRMHKKHGGPPPPGMFHGMWHHGGMMPKPHEMWHHMMPKPHEMCPPHKLHKMGHHKMHPPMFHKMHHKMHKKHHNKKHHGRSSSSSSSSSSESEDESLVEGIDKVQIGEVQKGEGNPSNETQAPPCDGDMCKEKFKCKKDKHFKSKEKKEKCKYCFKMMRKHGISPCWMQLNSMGEVPCRDSRYNKGVFNLPPPETSPDTEEGRLETGNNAPEDVSPQVRFNEVTGSAKTKTAGQRSARRGQRRGDSVDFFMQSIAEQIKKLPEFKIAEAKLKILEVVNEMQLDTAPEQGFSAEPMISENQQTHESQPETQTAS